MPVTITITKALDDSFASDSDLSELDDAAIIDIAMEDVESVLDGGVWTITRTGEAQRKVEHDDN